MDQFAIWSPFAMRMSVSVADQVRAMNGPDKSGWWRLDANDTAPTTDYGFLVDDDTKVYPDPRSRWQPNGVHGLSRTYDDAEFVWTDTGFQATPLAAGIIYELHVGTFTP